MSVIITDTRSEVKCGPVRIRLTLLHLKFYYFCSPPVEGLNQSYLCFIMMIKNLPKIFSMLDAVYFWHDFFHEEQSILQFIHFFQRQSSYNFMNVNSFFVIKLLAMNRAREYSAIRKIQPTRKLSWRLILTPFNSNTKKWAQPQSLLWHGLSGFQPRTSDWMGALKLIVLYILNKLHWL